MNHENIQAAEKSTGRGKALTIIGIVMCVILVPILIVNLTLIAKSYIYPDKYPTFAGYSMMIVLSRSMEPTIKEGDLIIVKESDISEVHGESSEGAADGTIISFFNPESQNRTVLTHRCVEVLTDESGGKVFKTMGDSNNTVDLTLAPAEDLIGVYAGRIPLAGSIAMWLQTIPGLIVCVVVPIVLFVTYDIVMKRRNDKAKRKDTDALLAELESLRAQKAAASADASEGESEL